jgi:predicted RNA-binding protein with PIN domain
MRSLVQELGDYAARSGDDVTVVLEGRPIEALERDGVRVVFAPRRGADAADDEIVRIVSEDPEPGSLEVVTSDRALRERVRARGAGVTSTSAFRRRLGGQGEA